MPTDPDPAPEPEPARPRWAAVVVNYETAALACDCVSSVLADTTAGAAEIVVVDNGSKDDSVAQLRTAYPDVRVVVSPGNLGYSRAVNLGTAATRAPIVAVLNADTKLEPGAAGALVRLLEEEPRIAAAGPRIRNLDGTDYPSARSFPGLVDAIGHGLLGMWWPTNPFTRRYRQLDADPATARLVDWLSGAAIWERRAALDEVGGWDERYFMYLEDTDLCWRLRRAGWDLVYEPSAAVEHVQGASTSRVPYRMLLEHHRSAYRFAKVRFTGAKAVLLPFAAVFFTFRAAMAMAEHAYRGWRA